jgi:hypothetical protein
MDETFEGYGAGPADSSDYVRRELFREWQRRRVVAVSVGDMYLALARAFANLGPRYISRVNSLTFQAIEWYQSAGLTRQGQVARRWAQGIHLAKWRGATR